MAQKDISLKIDAVVDSVQAISSLKEIDKTLSTISDLQKKIGDESSVQYKKLTDAANKVVEKQKELIAQQEELKIKNIETAAESIRTAGQLRRVLLEIESTQASIGDTSSEAYIRLQAAAQTATGSFENTAKTAASVRDNIGDFGDKIKTLEGSKVERLSGSFGLLKEGVMNLDFDKVKTGIGGFSQLASEKFSDVKEGLGGIRDGLKGAGERAGQMFKTFAASPMASIASGFGMITTSLSATTKAVWSNTASLLANPLFWLGAAIAGLIVLIVVLTAKFGILTAVIEKTTAVVNFLMSLMERFSDYLGLTTNAQDKFAKETSAAEEKRRAAMQETLDKQEDIYSRVQGMTEEEIIALYGKEQAEKIVGQNIYDIRKRNAEEQQKSFQKEIDAYDAIEKAGGKLSDEQIKARDAAKEGYKKAVDAEITAELDKKQQVEKITSDLNKTLESYRIKNIQDSDERRKAELKVQEQDALRQLEVQRVIMQGLGMTKELETLELAKTEITKYYANEAVKIDNEKNARIKAQTDKANDEAEAKAKEQAQKDLAALQLEEDKKIALTEAGSQARFKAETEKIDKTIEFYKNKGAALDVDTNRIIFDLEEKRKKVVADADAAQVESNAKAEEQRIKDEEIASQRKILEAQDREERLAAEIEAITKRKDNELLNTKLTVDERKIIELEAAAEIKALKDQAVEEERQRQQQLTDIANEAVITEAENNIARIQSELENENLKTEQKIELLNRLQEAELALIAEREAQALGALDNEYQARLKIAKTPEEALIIDQWYVGEKDRITQESADKETAIKEETLEKSKEIKRQELENILENSQKALDFTQKISDLGFAIFKNTRKKEANESDAQRKKRLQEEDKAARIQFAINKGIQLGTAVINGVQSILAITSTSLDPTGISTAIKIAAQVALNAASIAKIATQQYQPGGAGGSADAGISGTPTTTIPTTGAVGGAVPAAPTPPQFQAAQFFTLGQQVGPAAGGGQNPIQVVVTETDITSTQTRVRVIEDRATIG